MKRYTPSNAIIVLAATGLSVIIIFLAVKISLSVKKQPSAGEIIALGASAGLPSDVQSAEAQADDDNDGLKNWEEALWKTDPNKSDTDGDGISDGAEVAAGRDPSKPGPDDVLTTTTTPTITPKATTTSGTSASLTQTDIVAREFFSQYLQYKKAGVPLTADLENTIANNAIQKALTEGSAISTSPAVTVTFKTSSDNSAQSLSTYASALQTVLDNVGNVSLPQSSGQTDNGGVFSENEANQMNLLAVHIGQSVSTLQSMTVPSSAASMHASLIRSYSAFQTILGQVSLVYKDPIGAVVALKQFQTVGDDLAQALSDAGSFIDQHK